MVLNQVARLGSRLGGKSLCHLRTFTAVVGFRGGSGSELRSILDCQLLLRVLEGPFWFHIRAFPDGLPGFRSPDG